jgi:transcriptional regulatory protein LevR
MPNMLKRLMTDVPSGELARLALNAPFEKALVASCFAGLGGYTKLMQMLQKLDEEMTVAILRERAA